MKFQMIALCQITRGFIGRRKYCFLGLQPDKSSDMPTCREKLISYYFLRFKQDAIVTRQVVGKCLYFFSAESRGAGGKRGKNPFDPADTNPPGCFLCYLSPFLPLRFFPALPSPPHTTSGFTRHEIGQPNKANCRTFLAGWCRRRENEGVAAPLRAFACFSAVTLSWQSTGTRCCYRCRGSRASSASGSSRSLSSSKSPFISRSSLLSNERYATTNDADITLCLKWTLTNGAFSRLNLRRSLEESNWNN